MKKYIYLFLIFHAFSASCELGSGIFVADSLFTEKLYLQAIKEYSQFLDSVNADYALFKIGLSKKEIARFCVSENQFAKYPEM